MDRKVKAKRLLLCAAALLIIKKKQQKRRKKIWAQPCFQREQHENLSTTHTLTSSPNQDYVNDSFRVPASIFNDLLDKITPIISRQSTKFRQAISARSRLEATLRYLATGESYASLQYITKISRHSLGVIVPETCDAIYSVLKAHYLKVSHLHYCFSPSFPFIKYIYGLTLISSHH